MTEQNREEILSGMRDLIERLDRAAYRYYVLAKPDMDDATYDRLYDRLSALERETGIVLPQSPTLRVGTAEDGPFPAHQHLGRLYSMDKAQTREELQAWVQRMESANGGPVRFVMEHKFDGLTINLTYKDGELADAATRGNGISGERVLEQVRRIRDIPRVIPYRGTMEVQGEGIMRLSALKAYNEANPVPLKNARNGAAGALRNLDPGETERRNLSFFAHGIGYGPEFEDFNDYAAFLKAQGLPFHEPIGYAEGYKDLIRLFERALESRDDRDFDADGVVIKVMAYGLRRELGFTDHAPRWAIAFKYPALEVITTLTEVTWEVGRTGRVTPLAHLEPVELAGATVRRATLHNPVEAAKKGARPGARVWVRRSNDVIPEVLGAVEETDGEPLVCPEVCPACGAPLRREGPNLFCTNALACKPQLTLRLSHFASRDAMDIDTFSEKTALLFFERMGISDIADLYTLSFDSVSALPGFGRKKTENLFAALEKSKHVPLAKFLYALGIEGVGTKTAGDISAAFGTLENVRRAEEEDFARIDGVGEVTAHGLKLFFSDPGVENSLDRLLQAGVRPEEERSAEGPLSGKKIVLTGTLASMTRATAREHIEGLGGSVSESVGRKTDLVIIGENPGSKADKARQMNVPVMNETEFLALCKQQGVL